MVSFFENSSIVFFFLFGWLACICFKYNIRFYCMFEKYRVWIYWKNKHVLLMLLLYTVKDIGNVFNDLWITIYNNKKYNTVTNWNHTTTLLWKNCKIFHATNQPCFFVKYIELSVLSHFKDSTQNKNTLTYIAFDYFESLRINTDIELDR